MIPGIPTNQMPIDTFNKQLNELFANMRAHQQQQLKRQQLMQAMKNHADEMKFREKADKRAEGAEGRAQQTFVEKLKSLKNENELNDFLKQAMSGGNQMPMPGSNMQHEGAGQQQEGVENPNTGALQGEHEVDMNGQPVGNQENIQPEQPSQPNLEIFRKNPFLRGLYKKKYGVDPLAPISESPEVKRAADIEEAKTEAQNALDIKQAQKLREQAKDLELAGVDLEGIHDLLTGPDSLGTGISSSLVGKLGWGSEKLGSFNERALRLQAQMTKALSSRGGVGAAKVVEKGKPSTWKSTSENIGITDAYAERLKNEFELLNQEYKSITNKDLPYTLPEYVHNIGKKIEKNMFKPKTVFSNKKDYHDYMMSLTPEKRKLAINALRKA